MVSMGSSVAQMSLGAKEVTPASMLETRLAEENEVICQQLVENGLQNLIPKPLDK